MRAQTKLTLFGVAYLVGGLLVGGYALLHFSDAVAIAIALAWLALFGTLQFRLLRCHRCGWPLLLARRGRAVVPIGWIPERCAKCGAHTEERAGSRT